MFRSVNDYRALFRKNATADIGTALLAHALVARRFGYVDTESPAHVRLWERMYARHKKDRVDGRRALELLR